MSFASTRTFRAVTAFVVGAASAITGLTAVHSPASADPTVYNGLIAFEHANAVTTMRPDGTDRHSVAADLTVNPAWTADGTQLTFIDTPDPSTPGQNLAAAAPDGSGFHTLITGFDGVDVRWSPDGTQFAYRSFDSVARKSTVTFRNADGSNVRTPFVGDASAETDPAWFPSGDRVVMIRDGNVVAVNVDGTGLTTLADDPTLALASPTLSRDGSLLMFTKLHDSSTTDIFTANADGSGVARVGTKTLGTAPTLSPDGTKIAFVGDHSTGIWVVNLDGSGLQQLTTGYADGGPVWQYRATALPDLPPSGAPFNGKLAFLRSGEVYSANLDGTNVTDLLSAGSPMLSWTRDGATLGTPQGGSYTIMQPDGSLALCCHGPLSTPAFAVLSPDGTKLAYSRVTANQDDIFVSDIDGRNEVDVLARPGPDYFPSWSPDGMQIAFQSNQGNGLRVSVMNADGTNPHEVPNQPSGSSGLPSFSPDGTKLLFGNTPVVNGPTAELYVIGTDGSNLAQVGPTTKYIEGAHFAPDGTKIVFGTWLVSGQSNSVQTPNGVWTMNADGTNVRQITYGADSWPSWEPLVTKPANLSPRAFGTAQNKKPLALFADGSASFDGDGTITKYEWRWGDNTAMTPYKYAWHKYATAGTYLVRLTVTDDDGAKTTKKAWVKVN